MSLSGEPSLCLLDLLGVVSSFMYASSVMTGSLLRFPFASSNSSSEPANQLKGAATMLLMVPRNEPERARGAAWFCWVYVLIAVLDGERGSGTTWAVVVEEENEASHEQRMAV